MKFFQICLSACKDKLDSVRASSPGPRSSFMCGGGKKQITIPGCGGGSIGALLHDEHGCSCSNV
jgi:hypothetical protein